MNKAENVMVFETEVVQQPFSAAGSRETYCDSNVLRMSGGTLFSPRQGYRLLVPEDFRGFPHFPGECLNITFKYATTASYHTLFNSSFIITLPVGAI
jgi:hypothetical protein